VPSGLINDNDGMGSGCDGYGYLLQMKVHSVGITAWKDEARANAPGRADSAKDIG